MGDELVTTPDGLDDGSPILHMTSNRLIMLVDNDWPQPIISTAATEKAEKKAKRRLKKDVEEIARDNLLTIFKLVTKEIMDSSLVHGRLLDDNFVPLQQFFTVLEHIFLFCLKGKKLSILGNNKDFYPILEQVQKFCPEAVEITTTVKETSQIKTQTGRGRAWLRLAMMQKKLADYVNVLINRKDLLHDFYEPGGILLQEDAMMLHGLMVGLNCIDCHLSIRDNTLLDDPVGVIDYSLYLSEASLPGPEIDITESDSRAADLTVALDQNRFLEERNTHLTLGLNEAKQKVKELQATNKILLQEKAVTQKLLKDIQTENDLYRTENNRLTAEYDRRIQATVDDVVTERETYQTTREGLEQMYAECQKRLKDEIRLRQEVEKEVQQQISMRTETEMATRLLERDIHEKQDDIVAFRNQLQDVKGFNIEANSKLQILEAKHREKLSEIKKLEEIVQSIKSEKDQTNSRLKQAQADQLAAEETTRSVSQQLADSTEQCSNLETELKIEREWRTTLQQNLEKSQEKINTLNTQIKELKAVKMEHENLKLAHEELKKLNHDQELTLADMANQLSNSKLQHEDLREVQQALKDAHWADDDLVTNCKQCEKPFNISRRKHHCRNCGDIFCHDCSDQRMMLPSSAKPVRVCDSCHVILLSRASNS